MNEAQFKSSFLLSPIRKKQIKPSPNAKEAAVLIPFVVRDNQLNLLLTQRSKHLRHHPGQISFPGGRFETQDGTLSQTALRETQEEIGIDAKHVNILGQMGHYQTVSNYVVTPFVAFVNAEHQLTIDANEVADVFEVPWHFFTKRVNHIELMVRRQGHLHNVHFMPFEQRMVWGTTAAMINDLVSHFE